jgi:putative addiction module killer protein
MPSEKVLLSADGEREMRKRGSGATENSTRISRLALGNTGDVKPVGSGVSEMRIDYGPGYRVYFQQRGPAIALLLCAGAKSPQDADIRRAIQIAKDWKM